MAYIEKDDTGEFFNPVSCTVKINPDGSSSCPKCTPDDKGENYERWRWLIDNWDKMDFKERMALFMPYFHYVNVRNNRKAEFDDQFQKEMIETSYKTCRDFDKLKFDPDGQGIPNLIMIFKAINIFAIPDKATRSKVYAWGKANGFITMNCCC